MIEKTFFFNFNRAFHGLQNYPFSLFMCDVKAGAKSLLRKVHSYSPEELFS